MHFDTKNILKNNATTPQIGFQADRLIMISKV